MFTKKLIEKYNGRDVHRYVISNGRVEAAITDLGAAIEYLRVKDNNGIMRDICLTFERPSLRAASDTYCGAVIGRVANRIAGAAFVLNGQTYKLSVNDGANTLHGGAEGFDKRIFDVLHYEQNFVELCLVSPDGDQGFPGTLTFTVSFCIEGDSLLVKFSATSDKDTLFAPTIHPYFCFGESIYDTELKINARYYTPTDGAGVPTGESVSVTNTPFDFTSFKRIGADIDSAHPQIRQSRGYDHNFILDGSPALEVKDAATGIRMTLTTDFPALQFYTGNYFQKNDVCPYLPRQGFAVEPQYVPNAVNSRRFSSPVLKKGEKREYFIRYVFE